MYCKFVHYFAMHKKESKSHFKTIAKSVIECIVGPLEQGKLLQVSAWVGRSVVRPF